MKILIITQTIDSKNTVLGFFVRWVEEFSKKSEKVTVICLEKGHFSLNKNIEVYSLGKESGQSRLKYIKNFFKLIWNKRKEYDVVFIHMNQEYVLLGSLFWKLFRKKIFFWRNHPYGNFMTKLAVKISDYVFATSNKAFVSLYDKTILMPVGVDTRIFRIDDSKRIKGSILVFGRIAPVKRIELIIDTFANLLAKGKNISLSIVGDFLDKDRQYIEMLKNRIRKYKIEKHINIKGGVDFNEAVYIYQKHEIFLNFTGTGSFDKTIIEALACGCKVLTTNESLVETLPDGSVTATDEDRRVLMLEKLLSLENEALFEYRKKAKEMILYHSIDNTINTILQCINQSK